MRKNCTILIAEENERHFELICKSLSRGDLFNEMLHFTDGRKVLDFLFKANDSSEKEHRTREYILFLDTHLPKVDGVEVLRRIKEDQRLSGMPVIILSAVDDPHTIEACYTLGASTYIVKPAEYKDFEETVHKLGHFLSSIEIASVM